MPREVCFNESDVKLYIFLLTLILLYIFYIYFYSKNKNVKESLSNIDLNDILSKDQLKQKLKDLENELYNSQLQEQKCKIELNAVVQQTSNVQNKLLNKIYNPLVSPERIYPSGRLNMTSYSDYQLIGFIFNDTERYPLYGRPKYPGKTDKYEYYIIDESRNRLKIPFKSKNDNELYSGDTIDISGVGSSFNVNIYEYDTLRYDPNIY